MKLSLRARQSIRLACAMQAAEACMTDLKIWAVAALCQMPAVFVATYANHPREVSSSPWLVCMIESPASAPVYSTGPGERGRD